MTYAHLRDQIATEAARLLGRGKVTDLSAARKRAVRRYSDRSLSPAAIPSNHEILAKLEIQNGLFSAEHQKLHRIAQLDHLLQLMKKLEAFHPKGRLVSPEACGQTPNWVVQQHLSNEIIEVYVASRFPDPVLKVLSHYGIKVPRTALEFSFSPVSSWSCEVDDVMVLRWFGHESVEYYPPGLWSVSDVQTELSELQRFHSSRCDETTEADGNELFDLVELLLAPLENVRLPKEAHPEGDALYHTLQVFELAREHIPYDEEFLLAALLHDVGWAINPRHTEEATRDALLDLVTERMLFFVEQLASAHLYLRTGRAPRGLRQHPDWDLLVSLAKFDRDGRQPGASVCELADAIGYLKQIAGEYGETSPGSLPLEE